MIAVGHRVLTVEIANGASLSGAAEFGDRRLVAIQMPATWTAADLTFQASADGVTYANVYDEDDAEKTVQADAARFIQLNPADWVGVRWIKVRSGTSGAAVNQGGARTVTLILAS